MKPFFKKLGITAAALTSTACQTSTGTGAFALSAPDRFPPGATGVVTKTYMLQTCDRTEKTYHVEIDTDGKANRPEYVGTAIAFTNDAYEMRELRKTIKAYPVGKRVLLQRAADHFQFFEKERE